MKEIIEKLKIDIRHSEYFTSPRLWITRDEAQKIIEALDQPFLGCDSCEHWKEVNNYPYGSCDEIRGHLEIELHAGWKGATVGIIETQHDLSCIHHSEKIKHETK